MPLLNPTETHSLKFLKTVFLFFLHSLWFEFSFRWFYFRTKMIWVGLMWCVFWSQFHSDPVLAVNACYEGDVVIVCPGLYSITSSISIVDSIEVEGNHMIHRVHVCLNWPRFALTIVDIGVIGFITLCAYNEVSIDANSSPFGDNSLFWDQNRSPMRFG